jgi:phosphoserine phosphatase
VLIAFDLDGTLSADPSLVKLMKDLKGRGNKVVVLTGSHICPVTKAEKKMKKDELNALGLKGVYDKLKVYPNPPGKAKAEWCKKHDVSILIDNSLSNAQLAPDSTTVLVPWKSITP